MTQAVLVKIMLVFVASGLGGVLRYGVSGLVHRLFAREDAAATFPLGTLVVNVSGCLVAGFLVAALSGPVLIREEHRVALLVGLLGGYTTFSTFGRETMALAADRQWIFAGANVLLSVVLGLVGVWIGSRVAQWIYGV